MGEPASVVAAVVAARAVAAVAESVAGASAPFAAFALRPHCAASAADALDPDAAGASGVPDPASAGVSLAVAGISGPIWRCPCEARVGVPLAEDP